MDRGACWATVHGVAKESDMTERLTLSLLNIRIIYLNYLKNGDRLVLVLF